VGNPLGLEGTFSEGMISGIRSVDADSILQMTAPISPGSSGGPVMDATGAVIGIAEATFSQGQNLNLAVPVSYLSKLWASAEKNISVTALAQSEQTNQIDTSLVDRIATRTEAGVVVSNFEVHSFEHNYYGYEFRLTNKLPVAISNIRVRVIYYDASKSVMDFQDVYYDHSVPAGLAKTIRSDFDDVGSRAMAYYWSHGVDGKGLSSRSADNPYKAPVPAMEPIVELRVIDFRTERPE